MGLGPVRLLNDDTNWFRQASYPLFRHSPSRSFHPPNLAAHCLGQVVDEIDPARVLIRRRYPFYVILEFLL